MAAARDRNTDPRDLEELACHPDVYVRLAVAHNFSTPPHVAAVLAKDREPGVVQEALRLPGIPRNVSDAALHRLISYKIEFVIQSSYTHMTILDACAEAAMTGRLTAAQTLLAQHTHISEKALVMLTHSHDAGVRATAARRRKLTKAVQLRLARDAHPSVRWEIAGNSSVLPEVAELLAVDFDLDVVHILMTNTNVPQWIRDVAAKTEVEIVTGTHYAACNPHTKQWERIGPAPTAEHLAKLRLSLDADVRILAALVALDRGHATLGETMAFLNSQQAPTLVAEFLHDVSPETGVAILMRTQVHASPNAVLRRDWAQDQAAVVALAKQCIEHPIAAADMFLHCDVTFDVLRALSTRRRIELSHHDSRIAKIHPSAIEPLKGNRVRLHLSALIARNPSCPANLMEKIVAASPVAVAAMLWDATEQQLVEAARGTIFERLAAARSPRTPPHVLDELAMDEDASVRTAVATSAHAPDSARAVAALMSLAMK